jgi:hypothetical protein
LIVLIERIAEWSATDAALAVNPATREVPRMTTGLSLFFFLSYSGIPFEESRRRLLLYSEEVLLTVGARA